MKILKLDMKNNSAKVIPQTKTDLWHLSKLVEENDIVSASTDRLIKPREAGQKPFRQKMFLDIQVRETAFHPYSKTLKITGIIVGGKPEELVEIKASHSMEIELNEPIEIKKIKFKNYQLERLKGAEKERGEEKVLLCVMDDEAADLAELGRMGMEHKLTLSAHREGKRYKKEKDEGDYFKKLVQKLNDSPIQKVIIAGPGFAKEDFQKWISHNHIPFNKKPVWVAIASTGMTGLHELVKSGTIEKVISEMEIIQEAKIVEGVLSELGKNSGKVVFEKADLDKAIEMGAIELLLVNEELLSGKNKKEIEEVMENVEQSGGKVKLLSSENEAGKQLKSLNGLVGILKFKINW